MNKTSKVELHLHLDGSIRPETALELGKKYNIISQETTIKEIQLMLSVNKEADLKEYLKAFDLPIEIMQYKSAIERISYELVEDLYNDGTIYAEIRVAPIQHLKKGLNSSEVVESILKGFNRAQNSYPIKVNLLLCVMRHLSPMDNMFLLDLVNNFRNKGVVGLDLAGNEADFPASNFKKLFNQAKKSNIPFTIHAGEALGPASVWEAINIGASRIGHGVRSYEDADLLNEILNKKIHLELCPISNRDTGAIQDFKHYPIIDYLNKGISVSLNTDNRTVSNTTYNKEIDFLRNYMDITPNHIKQFNMNAINSAFISDKEKKYLQELL